MQWYAAETRITGFVHSCRFWYTENMITISVDDIQHDLLGYLKRVSDGETVLITQADQPVAELKPVAPTVRQPRPFGLCSGEFTIPDDFDAPLPEEVLAEFEKA